MAVRTWTLYKGRSDRFFDGDWTATLQLILSGKPFEMELLVREVKKKERKKCGSE